MQVRVFSDFDDTLLLGDSILLWLRFYYGKRPWRRFFLIGHGVGLVLLLLRVITSAGLKRIFLWPMAWEKPDELERLSREFVHAVLPRHFHGPMLRRLQAHHRLGHEIILISASATFYLRFLKELFPYAQVLGTEMNFPHRGLRLPTYVDGNLKGENKARLLYARGLVGETVGPPGPLPRAFAYSDHVSDIPLLRLAEFPVCVQPSLPLRRQAKVLGWPIFEWPGHAAWRIKTAKLRLLLTATGSWFPTRTPSPEPEPALTEEEFRHECEALAELVGRKYKAGRRVDVLRDILGEASLPTSPLDKG